MSNCELVILVISMLIFNASSENEDTTSENVKKCRERERLVTAAKDDAYKLVDAVIGQKLILQCHYCSEVDTPQPKIWYRTASASTHVASEVQLSMDSRSSLNRLHVNEAHSLIFRNVFQNDSGFYYCLGLEAQDAIKKYNYLIDTVFENETTAETGNLTDWKNYHDENFVPIGQLFENSNDSDYVYIREHLNLRFELFTEWDNWGPCQVCGRPQGSGQRRKKGICRIKFSSFDQNQTRPNATSRNEDEKILGFVDKLSCKSLVIERLFPNISNTIKMLPNFVQVEQCEGTCNPDAEGLNAGWKTGKSQGFKYKKSFVFAEEAHLTLVCPESTLENVVSWKKNGRVLKPGMSVEPSKPHQEPTITVDTFNTLYLHGVTSEEEGNYTCQVDNVRMQQVTIYVVSKSRLLTQAFLRHMMYLGFVLSLTLTCYCAGLVITWTKRDTFKTYEQIQKEENKENSGEEKDLMSDVESLNMS